jgi:hypothetical protein
MHKNKQHPTTTNFQLKNKEKRNKRKKEKEEGRKLRPMV